MPDRWLEYQALDDVRPALRNPKGHDKAGLAASVNRFGYVEPIILDERTGRLIAGHGRLDDLRTRQGTDETPPDGIHTDPEGRWLLPVVRGWASRSDSEADAYLLAANRLTESGGWQTDDLAAMLAELAATAEGLDGTGFVQTDLDDLVAGLQELPDLSWDADKQNGDTPRSGAYNEPSIRERLDDYAGKAVRSMVLDYGLDDFAAITEMAARVRAARGIVSNAELFLTLLREADVDASA